MEENHYVVLGLSPTNRNAYSQEDIKVAFRAQALKYHPDKNPNDRETAEKIFQKVTAANIILSDPSKRQKYDEELSQNPAALDNREHIFFTPEAGEASSVKPDKIDLTQLMRDANISPVSLLQTAAQNSKLAQTILFNSATLTQLP